MVLQPSSRMMEPTNLGAILSQMDFSSRNLIFIQFRWPQSSCLPLCSFSSNNLVILLFLQLDFLAPWNGVLRKAIRFSFLHLASRSHSCSCSHPCSHSHLHFTSHYVLLVPISSSMSSLAFEMILVEDGVDITWDTILADHGIGVVSEMIIPDDGVEVKPILADHGIEISSEMIPADDSVEITWEMIVFRVPFPFLFLLPFPFLFLFQFPFPFPFSLSFVGCHFFFHVF